MKEVAGRFEAATGSELKVFLDHNSIGWGENWREKISGAILGSTLFIPIITMRYFNHPNCREELSAFYSAAEQRGVSDLVLPIILAGKEQISKENPDDLVQVVAGLNWKSISDEFESGYESSAWKQRIGVIVKGLQDALERVGDNLSGDSPVGVPSASNVESLTEVDSETIERHISDLGAELSDIEPLMEQVGQAAIDRTAGREIGDMTVAQRSFFFKSLADDIREPAAEFGDKASRIEATARQLDAEMRAFIMEMYSIDPSDTQSQVEALRSQIEKSFSGVQESFAQLDNLEKTMRMAALASVTLRRAISPLTTGLRSLGTAMQIIISWQSIDPSGTGA
jgi:hypothetical protein